MKSKVFKHNVLIPYADVDQMGFVYYANYFVYFEIARSVLMREAGMPYGEFEKQGVMLPITEAHCDYFNAAHFDDLLEIRTTCAGIEGVRIKLAYEVYRDNELLVKGYTIHICMSQEGKVLRPHPFLKKAFFG